MYIINSVLNLCQLVLCSNTRIIHYKEEKGEKSKKKRSSRASSLETSLHVHLSRIRDRQFVAQFPKNDDMTAAQTAVMAGRGGTAGRARLTCKTTSTS